MPHPGEVPPAVVSLLARRLERSGFGATLVDLAARRTVQAAQARAEAETLSTLAGSVLRGPRPLPALLTRVRDTFALTDVTMLERASEVPSRVRRTDPRSWQIVASIGGRDRI